MLVRILTTGLVVHGRPTVWIHGGDIKHGWELEDGSHITYEEGERVMAPPTGKGGGKGGQEDAA